MNPPNNTRAVFMQLGYDIDDPDDILRLANALRQMVEDQEAKKRWSEAKRTYGLSALIVLLGSAATVIGEWLIGRTSGGHG